MDQINQIYYAIYSDRVTSFFSEVILVWLIIAVMAILLPPIRRREIGIKLVAITPNSLATLGVLGTFTGILIGLLDFDVTRVDDSVPKLLAGLKIAFATSIVGISAAICFRLLRALLPSGPISEEVSPSDIHSVLLEIRNDGRTFSERSSSQLVELRKAISSDEDSSLLTQVQKLRRIIQYGQAELIREFRKFAEHMIENNQKALIKALENVIRDFNENLTEQFGENFKQLNAAVEALVAWQDKYREHVEALEGQLKTAVSAIEASQRALESVQAHAEKIPDAISPLEPVLKGLNTQTEALAENLDAVAALRDRAIEAFPIVEHNLEIITTELTTSVENAVRQSRQTLSDAETSHTELRQGYRVFLENAGNTSERFSAELDKTLKQMSDQSAQEFARHGELIKTAASEAQEAINESWSESVDKRNKQFRAFDRQMQQEMQRSLELLGKNLASVSEKFVDDYTPITDRLRQLLDVGRGVN